MADSAIVASRRLYAAAAPPNKTQKTHRPPQGARRAPTARTAFPRSTAAACLPLPPLGAPTPRAAEWPGSAPPPGMAPGVPRVTPRNYPLFNSEDSATGDSSQSRGGGGSIDWRP